MNAQGSVRPDTAFGPPVIAVLPVAVFLPAWVALRLVPDRPVGFAHTPMTKGAPQRLMGGFVNARAL